MGGFETRKKLGIRTKGYCIKKIIKTDALQSYTPKLAVTRLKTENYLASNIAKKNIMVNRVRSKVGRMIRNNKSATQSPEDDRFREGPLLARKPLGNMK